MNNDIFNEWLRSHNISIIDKNKRFLRYNKLDLNFFTNIDDYNVVSKSSTVDTETLYTVEIPESDIRKLCDFENQVFGNLLEHGHYNLFEILMEQKEKEKKLRQKYPAVDLAYKNYSLMLKLAESGEL